MAVADHLEFRLGVKSLGGALRMSTVNISSSFFDNSELEELIKQVFEDKSIPKGLAEIRREPPHHRSIDTPLLVAIVGVAGPTLAAIITGIFSIIQKKTSKEIVCRIDGNKTSFTSNTMDETILADVLQQLDIDRIEVEMNIIRVVRKPPQQHNSN
jgi:hypothetical protein